MAGFQDFINAIAQQVSGATGGQPQQNRYLSGPNGAGIYPAAMGFNDPTRESLSMGSQQNAYMNGPAGSGPYPASMGFNDPTRELLPLLAALNNHRVASPSPDMYGRTRQDVTGMNPEMVKRGYQDAHGITAQGDYHHNPQQLHPAVQLLLQLLGGGGSSQATRR